jgi:sulfur-oxidizing protein SoxB
VGLSKREFLRLLGAASVAGFGVHHALAQDTALYDVPRHGQVSLLHFTDCHAQLRPLYYREPSVNIGVGAGDGRLPHLVGDALLKALHLQPGTREAHAFTHLDFERAARRYGRVGGFAHLATLVKRLKDSRPGSLLLDGGDTWQGSATALWTNAQDMVEASKLLGVDVMTGHWEFTYGAPRVQQILDGDLKGRIEFLAQNVRTTDFGDEVFTPYTLREINGAPVAIVGQAFPYTPVANPRYFTPEWSFGIREDELQKTVDDARAAGAHLVVLLSHNGMDVDLKLASRVSGIDVILGGHTHDGMPLPVAVKNRGGQTLVTNAGSNGKFLAVLDVELRDKRMASWRYTLLPVFANLLPADPQMEALIGNLRAPFESRLREPLAVSDDLLYRRGNFNGSWDQLICDALIDVQGADIAFSPGFRWGTSLLPGDTITREHLMEQTAITYAHGTLTEMSGAQIKDVLEDVADNLFNPDPYYQQGGDMVRVGGMRYSIAPRRTMGSRIGDMRLSDGRPLRADGRYKVAGWASVTEAARDAHAPPVWELVEEWLRHRPRVHLSSVQQPRLIGVEGNPGV